MSRRYGTEIAWKMYLIPLIACLLLGFMVLWLQYVQFGYWFEAKDFHHEDIAMFFFMSGFLFLLSMFIIDTRRRRRRRRR